MGCLTCSRTSAKRPNETACALKAWSLPPSSARNFTRSCPFALRVVGGYHQIGVFVSALADLPRLVTLHDFALRPNRSNAGLQLQISAKTYTYLGENK